jgi:hypothetical protein
MLKIKAHFYLIILLLPIFSCSRLNRDSAKIIFPQAFAFAVDDLGWNNGSYVVVNGNDGPYRLGINRHMNINDYKAVVDVGKTVGVRIQGLFILGEMDRNNTCAKYPTTNMYGKDWDNSKNVCNEQIEIMNYVREQAAYLEFGIHGVGHEFWPQKFKRVRAEWYDIDNKKPWPEEEMNNHIQCFKEIMAQYGLSPENGHSFPESFVPCAYGYYWNPKGKYSLGALLNKNGVKYANMGFSSIKELNPPDEPNGGSLDHGVLVINRASYGNDWYHLDALPTIPLKNQQTDIIDSHWPNWLAQDSFLQAQVSQKFIDYYKNVQSNPKRYIAKNTEQLYSQWLYKKYTKIEQTDFENVSIDNLMMPKDMYTNNLVGNLVLKIKLKKGTHVCSASLNDSSICSYFENEGYAFLYLPPLKIKKYTLKYKIGKNLMSEYVYNDGTYNVYQFKKGNNFILIDMKVYGTQTVKVFGINNPLKIESDNKNLIIQNSEYSKKLRMLMINIQAHNIQGNQGVLKLYY